jgi:hypothetical protein
MTAGLSMSPQITPIVHLVGMIAGETQQMDALAISIRAMIED